MEQVISSLVQWFIKGTILNIQLTLSGSLWTSIKAEYSNIRSLEEAIVRSCHTGTAVAVGAGGGAKGS